MGLAGGATSPVPVLQLAGLLQKALVLAPLPFQTAD
jgi:hypothetical protein